MNSCKQNILSRENLKFIYGIYRKYRRIRAKFIGRINPKFLANDIFRNRFHRNIDWNNPTDLNEKIQWLKFYSDTKKWTLCADKYKVRDYVSAATVRKNFRNMMS